MEVAIRIHNLHKRYKIKDNSFHTALNGVNLDIPKGRVFSLLGPNGSGKSTLIGIVSGTVRKTSGCVNVMGFDLDRDNLSVRKNISVTPQEVNINNFFTVNESLAVAQGMYNIAFDQDKIDFFLNQVGLYEDKNSRSATLSGGMKKRLSIAKSLIAETPIIFLDEPTVGVDIDIRARIWDFIKEIQSHGKTIILTTHHLDEAEYLASDFAFLKKGSVVRVCTKEEVNSQFSSVFEVITQSTITDQVTNKLLEKGLLIKQSNIPCNITVTVEKNNLSIKNSCYNIATLLYHEGIDFYSISCRKRTLESLFSELTLR